jgi:hypothetical protein
MSGTVRSEATMSDEQAGASKQTGAGESAAPTGEPRSLFPRWLSPRVLMYAAGAAITLLMALALAAYAWKLVAVRGLERRLAAERSASGSAQRQALSGQARELLRLTARPLAWAVRAEMLRDNLGQVDDYFREFVRERGVSSLILVGKDGKIALATNRKLETQAAETVISKSLLEASDVEVEESGSTLRMAVPIVGFDRRLGTLVIDYDGQGR